MADEPNLQDAYRLLMAAIISRAMEDLQGNYEVSKSQKARGRIKDGFMSWFYSPDFEAYCLVLEIDPEPIREKAAEYYRCEIAKEDPKPSRKRTTDTTRKKQSEAAQAYFANPENRKKQSATLKAFWANKKSPRNVQGQVNQRRE
ncbi:hypothetical protein [Leadbettera azotonutricia]|uniref:Uncharacterized protein n=1 Tax=Leadbettera azotonutricia (strain ATCC BAA-888 / DSM 13862 / ZAS-9) TaxID=545695 RepID=F5YF68_LEAAZ|nr:hypothetical protein [Leadbettera azotonutricia]AEF82189.1 hypothetical protein TREAZ_2495 [Leadbettera azotonutricia ZAS-9]